MVNGGPWPVHVCMIGGNVATELSIAILCAKVLGVLMAAGLGLLFVAGAVNCRAEEEYWDRFWSDTPIACLGADDLVECEIIDFPIELRLAA